MCTSVRLKNTDTDTHIRHPSCHADVDQIRLDHPIQDRIVRRLRAERLGTSETDAWQRSSFGMLWYAMV